MRETKLAVLACLAVVFSAVAIYAASAQWTSGPTFSMVSSDLLVSGSLTGLGNKANVQVDATGEATGSCTNPGGHQPKPFSGEITGSGAMVHAHNGSADVAIYVSPNNICPSNSWTADITSIQWDTATVTVYTSKKGVETNLIGPTTYGLTDCTTDNTNCSGSPE